MGRIPGMTSMFMACPPDLYTHVHLCMSLLLAEIVLLGVQLHFAWSSDCALHARHKGLLPQQIREQTLILRCTQ